MGVPARHREPARSGEAGVPPGNRPAAPRDWSRTVPERYVAGEVVLSEAEGTPKDARKNDYGLLIEELVFKFQISSTKSQTISNFQSTIFKTR